MDNESIETQADSLLQVVDSLFLKKEESFEEIGEDTKLLNYIKVKEFLKIWNSITGLYNSPWECVRELFVLMLM